MTKIALVMFFVMCVLLWAQTHDSANLSNLIIWTRVTGTGSSIPGPGVELVSPATGAFRVHDTTKLQGITLSADDRIDQPVLNQPWLRIGGIGHSDLMINAGGTNAKLRLLGDMGDEVIVSGDVTVDPLAGVGNAYACVNTSGTLYRSAVPCL